MTDNEHDIVVVDCHAQRVFLIQASDLDANRRVPEDYAPAPKQSWTFNEFIT